MNVLFVGDILQLPPVNGTPVFDILTNKSVASKVGCMTSAVSTVPLPNAKHARISIHTFCAD